MPHPDRCNFAPCTPVKHATERQGDEMRQIGMFAGIVFILLPAAAPAASPPKPSPGIAQARGPVLTVGRPIARSNLAVFPVYSPARRAMPSNYLTLDEALQRRLILVQEMPASEVNRISVTNKADRPIFLMA